ncbi:rhomboid family intramembrane serine protease [Bdellovibrio bacteriovorus]|uniref:Rhomboid family intramembrane serine protease n=1 Tax=Bdellovibrio bacteriovorus TaxID=959 RepID=A0A150WTS8_BDEBC|nr:rhomboid family intramembrane serine protease [Bdellovibrio bacteriovorus]KYG69928.1 rhomboid family intramembrane serine protease [Bdellovibrio bacteriovorus]
MQPAARTWTVIRSTWLTRKPSGRAWFAASWSVLFLIIGSVFYWQNFYKFSTWMSASQFSVFSQHQYWRLWTTLFAHADLGHLASNSILFFIFGYFLSGYFGLWVFPILAFLLGGVTNALTILTYAPDINLIGVSGVVYWMGGMWLVLYLMLDEQRTWLQRSLRAVGVALGVFMPSTAFEPNVSYRAHLIGFVVGVVTGFIYYLFRKKEFKSAVTYEIVRDDELQPELQSESSNSQVERF